MSLERIIICFHPDGKFRGASATDFGGQPVHLEPKELSAMFPDLNAAALARVAALESELAEAPYRPEPTAPADDLAARLNATFKTSLPPEVQAKFAVPYAIVRVLVQAGELDLAAAVIAGIEVPPELEPVKSGLMSIIRSQTVPEVAAEAEPDATGKTPTTKNDV